MTPVVELSTLELTVEAAFGEAPECEMCVLPAVWWFTTQPCGCRHALCDGHRDTTQRLQRFRALEQQPSVCRACLTNVDASIWEKAA